MLYRFREAQATSLGLTPKPTRRPRLASSVTSLKECERWRGEVLREISRKVSKIQDFGLTDYEVRDLNDEINKLLREKTHWENQIVALGGANYKRGVPSMLGGAAAADGGVGTGAYKYFGRAKDLPGVKELFTGKARSEADEWRSERYQRFRNLPPSYFGDEDEDDGLLLEEEVKAEEEEWSERYRKVIKGLSRDLSRRDGAEEAIEEAMDTSEEEDISNDDIQVASIPRPHPKPWKESMQAFYAQSQPHASEYTQPASVQAEAEAKDEPENENAKRPPPASTDGEAEVGAKRQKGTDGQPVSPQHAPATPDAAQGYSIFSAQDLQSPAVPDRAALEKMILQAKKRQLREEYIGPSN